MCTVPNDDRAVRHECDEGGEPPCWAHLLDDDGTFDHTEPDADKARREDGIETAPAS
jgi:hypothetical protein